MDGWSAKSPAHARLSSRVEAVRHRVQVVSEETGVHIERHGSTTSTPGAFHGFAGYAYLNVKRHDDLAVRSTQLPRLFP